MFIQSVTLKSIEHTTPTERSVGVALAKVELAMSDKAGEKRVEIHALEEMAKILDDLGIPLKIERGVFDYTLIDGGGKGAIYNKKVDMRKGKNKPKVYFEAAVTSYLRMRVRLEGV